MKNLRLITAVIMASALLNIVGCAETPTRESTGQYSDDVVLSTRVRTALFQDSTLKSSTIAVNTFKGEVQLSGFADSPAQAEKAVAIAKAIPGVVSVKNDMRIKGR
jgi:osmotically-inducible protein OsmY